MSPHNGSESGPASPPWRAIPFGIPVVPDENRMNSGCANGSLSKRGSILRPPASYSRRSAVEMQFSPRNAIATTCSSDGSPPDGDRDWVLTLPTLAWLPTRSSATSAAHAHTRPYPCTSIHPHRGRHHARRADYATVGRRRDAQAKSPHEGIAHRQADRPAQTGPILVESEGIAG